jgi:hypothetical protein
MPSWFGYGTAEGKGKPQMKGCREIMVCGPFHKPPKSEVRIKEIRKDII